MKVLKVVLWVALLVLFGLFQGPAFSSDKEREMKEIGKMDIKALASRAKAALDKKYPGENWEKYKFPKYVYIQEAVQIAYKIAVKRPELLAKFPCYCFCEGMGHKNLAYCFLEKGEAGGKFDDHASTCNICFAQAMMAFLWEEIGASEAEMQKAMKEVYEK
ncbi:MAG: hypothetical protein EHM36_10695 [Deltaproteobacteria bacterium]|nr:MAG: hypothetical protein EHM36_10695 [Deltaproteobacteria bacterium]